MKYLVMTLWIFGFTVASADAQVNSSVDSSVPRSTMDYNYGPVNNDDCSSVIDSLNAKLKNIETQDGLAEGLLHVSGSIEANQHDSRGEVLSSTCILHLTSTAPQALFVVKTEELPVSMDDCGDAAEKIGRQANAFLSRSYAQGWFFDLTCGATFVSVQISQN